MSNIPSVGRQNVISDMHAVLQHRLDGGRLAQFSVLQLGGSFSWGCFQATSDTPPGSAILLEQKHPHPGGNISLLNGEFCQ